MTTADPAEVHAAWLPPEAFRSLGSRRILVCADGTLADTVFREVAQACDRYGGSARRGPPGAADSPPAGDDRPCADGTPFDLILALASTRPLPAAAGTVRTEFRRRYARCADTPGDDGFALAHHGDVTVMMADRPTGLLYGLFHLVRLGESAFGAARRMELHRPAMGLRMVDH